VPAAREQADEWGLDGSVAEIQRGDVPLQVVDRDERDAARPGDRLGRREPDEQRSDKPRALGDADSRDLPEADAGPVE